MITAEKIRRLAYLDTIALETAVRKNYPKDKFISCRFLGITNAGQFCYEALYFDNIEGENLPTKVFVDLGADEQPVGEY